MIGVNKWFGDFHVLKDINLTVGTGERVVICGPSGSGKSTVVRCINRLEAHQKGTIRVDGIELTDDAAVGRGDPVRGRHGVPAVQPVPASDACCENLTLGPMKARGLSRTEAEARARKYLDRVRIPEQADKRPGQLSGGQQQRVAIARSLVHGAEGDAVRRADHRRWTPR